MLVIFAWVEVYTYFKILHVGIFAWWEYTIEAFPRVIERLIDLEQILATTTYLNRFSAAHFDRAMQVTNFRSASWVTIDVGDAYILIFQVIL